MATAVVGHYAKALGENSICASQSSELSGQP